MEAAVASEPRTQKPEKAPVPFCKVKAAWLPKEPSSVR